MRCLFFGNGRLYAVTFSLQQLFQRNWGLDYFDTQWQPFEPRKESNFILQCVARGAGADLWIGARSRLCCVREDRVIEWVQKEYRVGGEIGAGEFLVNPEANSSIPGSRVYCLLVDTSDSLSGTALPGVLFGLVTQRLSGQAVRVGFHNVVPALDV